MVFGAITKAFDTAANHLRDTGLLSEKEVKARDAGKAALEMIKLAAVATAIAAVFFVAVSPNLFAFCLAGAVGLGAIEIYKIAGNVWEMLDTARVELVARSGKKQLIDHVFKNTWVALPGVRLLNPNVDRFLFAAAREGESKGTWDKHEG